MEGMLKDKRQRMFCLASAHSPLPSSLLAHWEQSEINADKEGF
jgi:hypothetical protein